MKKFFSNFFSEEKAQAGAVFRLMVDSIIMLAVLIIIISALQQFQGMMQDISTKEFNELMLSAVKLPSGEVIASRELSFPEGRGYTVSNLSALTGEPPRSFVLLSNLSAVEILTNPYSITFNRSVQAKVYAICKPADQLTACKTGCGEGLNPVGDGGICKLDCIEICCNISFGQQISNNDFIQCPPAD
ncbi:MAG: hypothetical protein WC874_01785 [Candidatus Izemoplasmatales bacterium]|jgi:hypothetical protein